MECNICHDEIYPYQEWTFDDEDNPCHKQCVFPKQSEGGKE